MKTTKVFLSAAAVAAFVLLGVGGTPASADTNLVDVIQAACSTPGEPSSCGPYEPVLEDATRNPAAEFLADVCELPEPEMRDRVDLFHEVGASTMHVCFTPDGSHHIALASPNLFQ